MLKSEVVLWCLVFSESWPPAPQSPSSPTTSLPIRVLPSLSTQDMKTAGQCCLTLESESKLDHVSFFLKRMYL